MLFVVACGVMPAQMSIAQSNAPETQPVLLKMVRDDAIHRELKLSDDQIQKVFVALQTIDGPWFRVRIRPVEERIATLKKLTDDLTQSLQEFLDADQLARLDQLQNQALGTRMIVRDQTAAGLKLSTAKRAELLQLFRKTDKTVADARAKLNEREIEPAEAARTIKKAQADEKNSFVAAMSNEQKRMLSSLTGPGFDFGSVKRSYPLAPELTKEGGQWLQSSGVELQDLKGKVVALHFYAFQCINCRRNLPHYNGWHTDYADKGLVVIGIQTPETPSERVAERVAAAIKSEQIEYPVLMDAQSANWKQWSNTMWPTVYLIDKKGFLRRWWQGEMNWNGNPGEKDMRKTIEQLLAEDA